MHCVNADDAVPGLKRHSPSRLGVSSASEAVTRGQLGDESMDEKEYDIYEDFADDQGLSTQSMSPSEGSRSSISPSPDKKPKNCLVCGDKALGCNFNAITCESCKAFFRRNAHKTIRGRCEGTCEVTTESRAFCKRCRLAKCFTVGMRKEMILNDEQKMQRKQKIIVNKLRRHVHMFPQDTYSASPKDLLSCTPKLRDTIINDMKLDSGENTSSKARRQSRLRDQDAVATLRTNNKKSPALNLKDEWLSPVNRAFPSASSKGEFAADSSSSPTSSSCSSSSTASTFSPWLDSQAKVEAAIDSLEPDDKAIITELRMAVDKTSFLAMSSSSLKTIPTTPEELVNVADSFVRKIIKMAKNLSSFCQLHRQDQIALLKGSVVDIMMLRSAVNYDPFTETWSLSTRNCVRDGAHKSAGERLSAHLLMAGSEETRRLFMTYSKFIKSVMSIIHGDLLVLSLLIIIALFSADRAPMIEHGKVQTIQERYARILESYVYTRFSAESTLFARMLTKLTDLRNINEVHSNMLLSMDMQDCEPLLLEVFDIPSGNQSPMSHNPSSNNADAPAAAATAAVSSSSSPSSCSSFHGGVRRQTSSPVSDKIPTSLPGSAKASSWS